jgi:ankyrin repeat protein
MAVRNGLSRIIRQLVEKEANFQELNENGYTPLYEALLQGHDEAVDMILQLSVGTNLNTIIYASQGATALHIACRFAYMDVVDQLLSKGVYANVADAQGNTPLHEVVKQTEMGREEDVSDTVQSLIDYGADSAQKKSCRPD